MSYINLQDFNSDQPLDDLFNRFSKINRLGDLTNSKINDVLSKLTQIIEHQNYLGLFVVDNCKNKQFILLNDKLYLMNFICWMSTVTDNQLRDVVNRIYFVYNTLKI